MMTTRDSISDTGRPSAEGRPFSRPIDTPIWRTAHRWDGAEEVIDVLEGPRCLATVYHTPGQPATVWNHQATRHDMWLIRCYARSISAESALRAMDSAAATLSSTLQPAHQ